MSDAEWAFTLEAEMVRAARGGDDYIFGELVARYGKLVLTVALRLMRNRADAEDVAQEVFLRVHRKIRSYDPSRPFVPWLYKITLNVAYSRLRKGSRREESSLEQLQPRFEEDGSLPPELVHAPDLEQRLATHEMARQAEEAIAELPEACGTVVWMHDVADIPAATLSEVLRLSIPAIKSRLHRGRLAVRTRLVGIRPEKGRPGLGPGRSPASRRGTGVTCREVVEGLLLDYLFGRLGEEDRQRFESHLRVCDRCRPFVESYRAVVRGLARLPEPPLPSEMVHATLDFVRESLKRGRYLNRNWAAGLSVAFPARLRRFRRVF
jgi:RNA polymerase sigma-70 factor (ECF subfamily)